MDLGFVKGQKNVGAATDVGIGGMRLDDTLRDAQRPVLLHIRKVEG